MNSDLTQLNSLLSKSWSNARATTAAMLASPWMLALVYLFDLALAEAMTMLVAPRAGMIAHGVVFVLLLLHSSLAARGFQQKFLLTLSLAPLIRVLSLAMPLIHFPLVYWYLVVGTPLFVAAYLSARQAKLSREMIGLQVRYWPLQLLIGLFGICLGLIEYLILRPQPLVAELRWELVLVPALILLFFTGFLEELIFRGLMQATAWQYLGRGGLFYIAGVFAVLHLGYRSVIDVLFVFGVALLFGLLVPRRNGSLLGVTLAHGLTNISLYLVFPFLLAQPATPISAPPDILAPAALVTPDPNRLLTTPFLPAPDTPTPTATLLPPTATTPPSATPSPSPTVALPTATASPTACLPPPGWVPYFVSPGDSLSTIGQRYGVSGLVIKLANCLEEPVSLSLGQMLYVPNRAPQPTLQPTKEEPAVPTQPSSPGPPTSEATSTPEPDEPTATPIRPADTPTPAPTDEPPPPTLPPTEEPPTPAPTEAPTEGPPTPAPTEARPKRSNQQTHPGGHARDEFVLSFSHFLGYAKVSCFTRRWPC